MPPDSSLINTAPSLPVDSDSSLEQIAPPAFADSNMDVDTTPTTEMSDQFDVQYELTTNTSRDEEVDKMEEMKEMRDLDTLDQKMDISDKMRHLTAAAWAMEQDNEMTGIRRCKIHKLLQELEMILEDDSASDAESDAAFNKSERDTGKPEELEERGIVVSHPEVQPTLDSEHKSPSKSIEIDTEAITLTEADLRAVQATLAATIDSMRLRQQEQKHLHTLTVQKIEAIAQRCIAQESRIQDLVNELTNLRTENHTLGQQNDNLVSEIEVLERERELKAVTVTAMTSAVAGLEGWIESTTSPARQDTPLKNTPQNRLNGKLHSRDQPSSRETSHSPLRQTTTANGTAVTNKDTDPRRRRSIVKGRGRFRGRHYIDDPEDPYHINNNDPHSQYSTQDFHDGLKAWIRGFRDVEECASSPTLPPHSYVHSQSRSHSHSRLRSSYSHSYSPSRKERENAVRPDAVNVSLDDEWGDFESPT